MNNNDPESIRCSEFLAQFVQCPQCGFEEADYICWYKSGEDETTCLRCGYHEWWGIKRDDEDNYCEDVNHHWIWKHGTDKGYGVLCYRETGQIAYIYRDLYSPQELVDVEAWLHEQLRKGEVEADSYLTRWNDETKQVDSVIGKPRREGYFC
jgi:hypothetical protein